MAGTAVGTKALRHAGLGMLRQRGGRSCVVWAHRGVMLGDDAGGSPGCWRGGLWGPGVEPNGQDAERGRLGSGSAGGAD